MHELDSLAGKQALVCGGNTGIGRAAALALARRGASVTVLARDADKLDAVVAELKEAGAPTAWRIAADLDQRDAAEKRLHRHLDAHGPIHILVNNTGGPPVAKLLDVHDEAAFTVPFGRHILASQRFVQALLPGMQDAGYGRIINVISTSVREPIPGLGISNLIRAAMASWAKTLSRELPPGVTINSVLPGFTDTERLDAIRTAAAANAGGDEDAVQQRWLAETPEGRLGRPHELGEAIAWLASPAASFVRGVVLPVDGGRLRSI